MEICILISMCSFHLAMIKYYFLRNSERWRFESQFQNAAIPKIGPYEGRKKITSPGPYSHITF